MAGDWIKLDVTVHEKPEVVMMAAELDMHELDVVGRLARVWIWADQQSVNGDAVSVTAAFLDRLTQCNGFASAMRKAGWLEGRDGSLSIPNFDRHNGQTAKTRALGRNRNQSYRAKNRDGESVTNASLEKRREENINIPPKSPKKGDSQKTTSQKLSWSVADGWQGVTDDLRAKWKLAYPACDIDRHLAAMDVWLRANPTRAVKSNWAAFAARWLSKEQNSGGDLRYKNQGGTNAAYRNRNQQGRTVGTLNEGADFTRGVKKAADLVSADDNMDDVPQ